MADDAPVVARNVALSENVITAPNAVVESNHIETSGMSVFLVDNTVQIPVRFEIFIQLAYRKGEVPSQYAARLRPRPDNKAINVPIQILIAFQLLTVAAAVARV